MAGSVARGQARQRAGDLHVEVFLGDRQADEVVGAEGRKHGISGREGHEALPRHPGGGAHQELLRHAHLVEAVRMGLRENMQIGVLAEVCRQAVDFGPCFGECRERMAEGRRLGALPRRGQGCDHSRGGQAGGTFLAALTLFREPDRPHVFRALHACLPVARIWIAFCHSCGSTRRKWFLSRSSKNGTPLAIFVSQMMMRGLGSVSSRALSKAWTRASMSLPFTRWTCQPNASNFGASGSKFRTFVEGPSAC